MADTDNKPAFDPSQPFDTDKPAFDPSQPFDATPQGGVLSKLGQTWPARLAQSAYQAATLPGDVATGATNVSPTKPGMWSDEDEARLQLTNAEIANRARDLAAFGTPASAAARTPQGLGVPFAQREPVAPSIGQLKQAAVAGYESPTVAAVRMHPEVGPRLSQEIQANLNDAGIDENLAPKTFGILNKLNKAPEVEEGEAKPFLTVDNLRSLRRTLGNAAGSPDGTERLAAKSSIQHLDEFLSDLPAADVIEGNPNSAAAILKEANANYTAMKTSADLDTRMTKAYLRAKAANSGMNIANTIRQRMVDIATNPKLGRGFTPDEMAQVQRIAEGTPTENIMRGAGNILGGGGGMLSAGWLASGLGTHGLSSLAPIAGYALRKISNAMAMRKAANLSESVRMRSPLAQQPHFEALEQTARPDLNVRALPALQAAGPSIQLPAMAEAQPDQNNVPRPPAEQKYGGAVKSNTKLSHAKVHYVRQSPHKGKTCSTCSMFTEGHCTLVVDPIYAPGYCNRWEKKRERAKGGKIVHSHDVVSGADSSDNKVEIDRHIPEFSKKVKGHNGQPANLWKYLAIHEKTETRWMKHGLSYKDAHIKATAKERQAVERDGIKWAHYEEEMDGYLSRIEHEKAVNPPKEKLHVDPKEAIKRADGGRLPSKTPPPQWNPPVIPDQWAQSMSPELQRQVGTNTLRDRMLRNLGVDTVYPFGRFDDTATPEELARENQFGSGKATQDYLKGVQNQMERDLNNIPGDATIFEPHPENIKRGGRV